MNLVCTVYKSPELLEVEKEEEAEEFWEFLNLCFPH